VGHHIRINFGESRIHQGRSTPEPEVNLNPQPCQELYKVSPEFFVLVPAQSAVTEMKGHSAALRAFIVPIRQLQLSSKFLLYVPGSHRTLSYTP